MLNTMKNYLDLIPLMDVSSVARQAGRTKISDLPDSTRTPMSAPAEAQCATERSSVQEQDLSESTM